MKNIVYLIAVGSLVLGSCKKEVVEAPNAIALPSEGVILPPSPNQTAPNGIQQNAQAPAGGNSILYGQPTTAGSTANATTGQTYTTTTVPATATAVPATTAKGMNPPHGQPNHRCDIAVGAPLNSPPGKVPAPSTPAPTIVPTPQASTPVVTTTTAVTPTTTPTTAAGATTAVPNLLATPVTTAPGMNPPHGQEGHVCSVAVGAPLPK